ncbi:hypothetical protein JCGZ_05148 [Jatropha curcas]|uniref:Uncharacterized protein n=1 Tax=Jatropha curcas TaxID=180498 RepID=A0A067KTI4_JATCU|nr:hypothetical protein JCGZ_05148 [Jatropha curcas]
MKSKPTHADDLVKLSNGFEASNHRSPRTKLPEHESSSNGNSPAAENNSSYTFLEEIENLNVDNLNDFPQEKRKTNPGTPKSLGPILDENIVNISNKSPLPSQKIQDLQAKIAKLEVEDVSLSTLEVELKDKYTTDVVFVKTQSNALKSLIPQVQSQVIDLKSHTDFLSSCEDKWRQLYNLDFKSL